MIRRYPNRRLYDTDESGYVTAEDVRARLAKGARVTGPGEMDVTARVVAQLVATDIRAGRIPLDVVLKLIRPKPQPPVKEET
jgi:polyhydroxyalkanoate synthesis regulator protein